MELKQLEYFVAVAEEANFTRAAERVHISQSGVSAQIRQLERELGAPLFDRSGRAATLTQAGEAALEHARAALRAAQAVRDAVDQVNGVTRGRLVVGMVTACTVTPLFDALSEFHQAFPGVEITLVEDDSLVLLDRLRAGSVDIALVGAAAEPDGLDSLTVVKDRLVAAFPATHPLAAAPAVRLADLARHPLICLPEGTGVRAVFDAECARAGVRCRVELQASAPATVADLAGRGLGVAVLSASIIATEGLTSRRNEDAGADALLCLAWPVSPGPALSRLLDFCRAAFNS